MQTYIALKEQEQTNTHILINSGSKFTFFQLIQLNSDGTEQIAFNSDIEIIKHEKNIRLSPKKMNEYHEFGIQKAKEKYSKLI